MPGREPPSTAPTVPPSEMPAVDPQAASLDEGFESRYRTGDAIGVGGMGEVRLCRDLRVGRNVALKAIRPELAKGDLVDRFLREVRIQGQLEHPAIVPVYDVGRAPDGRPFFTMKRV